MPLVNFLNGVWNSFLASPPQQMVMGILVLAAGIIIAQTREDQATIGLILVVIGLGSLLFGASHFSEEGKKPSKSRPAASAPVGPKSYGRIELESPPPNKGR
jgi:hypothetical protein